MQQEPFLNHFINKSVPFTFQRQSLRFHLSQSLFSSFDVDAGTKLLLKTIAQQVHIERVHTVLDVGCGVGIIAVCLKKRHPHLAVTAQDRDALALAFTSLNGWENGIEDVDLRGSLGLEDIEGARFDLIVSNLPGKAGSPVLSDMLARIPAFLTEDGLAAVVIVKPLADLVTQTLKERGSEIVFSERAKDHVVFHFCGGSPTERPHPSLQAYLRGSHRFKAGGVTFRQLTAYNIPEFDSLGYHTQLALTALRGQQIAGRVLFWNPGQGHLPAFIALTHGQHISDYVIAGRDLLGLRVTGRNMVDHGVDERAVVAIHVPHFLYGEGPFDFAVIVPDIDPGVPWHTVLLEHCKRILVPGGRALITARSSAMHRFLSAGSDLSILTSKKRHGHRAVVLQKPAGDS